MGLGERVLIEIESSEKDFHIWYQGLYSIKIPKTLLEGYDELEKKVRKEQIARELASLATKAYQFTNETSNGHIEVTFYAFMPPE
jgi:hypothetical protein